MRKNVLGAALAFCLAAGFQPVLADETETGASDITYMGSSEATDVNVGLIMGPPSMGMGWFINEAKEGNTYNHFNFEVGGVDYTALAAKFNTGEYDIIHCPSNVGAILYNNEDMNEDAVAIDIGNLGLLYVLTIRTERFILLERADRRSTLSAISSIRKAFRTA